MIGNGGSGIKTLNSVNIPPIIDVNNFPQFAFVAPQPMTLKSLYITAHDLGNPIVGANVNLVVQVYTAPPMPDITNEQFTSTGLLVTVTGLVSQTVSGSSNFDVRLNAGDQVLLIGYESTNIGTNFSGIDGGIRYTVP